MPSGSVQYRTLQTALLLAGSVQRLAEVLGATEDEAARWLDGKEDLPMPAFFAAVEYLLEHLRAFVYSAGGRSACGTDN